MKKNFEEGIYALKTYRLSSLMRSRVSQHQHLLNVGQWLEKNLRDKRRTVYGQWCIFKALDNMKDKII